MVLLHQPECTADSRRARARRVVGASVLFLYVGALGWAMLNPDLASPLRLLREVQNAALDAGYTWSWVRHIEFVANIAVVVPLPIALSFVWRSRTVAWWTTTAFIASCAIETIQLVAMSQRTASAADIVANTIGGLIGGTLAQLVRCSDERRVSS